MRRTGEWISTAPTRHRCLPPAAALWLPWRAKIGARWRCECGQVWILGRTRARGDRKWILIRPPGQLQVFREATDTQVCYWLGEEFDDLRQHRDPLEVVEALQKHFTIGVQS